MIVETIRLHTDDDAVKLVTYAAENSLELKMSPRPAMLVLPGGGYQMLSAREAEPIAKAFVAEGFQAFVLYYSLKEKARFPRPLQQASEAIAYIRRNAARYTVDPDKIFVVGFSAGRHLAASIGTMYDREEAAFPGMEPGENRPTGMILSYAPTCADTKKIAASFIRTLGGEATEEVRRRWSPACNVTKDTAPAYIWHTADDPVVPVEHALIMANAMAEAHVPFELHIFPHGQHGLALANRETWSQNPGNLREDAAAWVSEAAAFCRRL